MRQIKQTTTNKEFNKQTTNQRNKVQNFEAYELQDDKV